MRSWPVQDAKARFSQAPDACLSGLFRSPGEAGIFLLNPLKISA